jgi:hypothetical protein
MRMKKGPRPALDIHPYPSVERPTPRIQLPFVVQVGSHRGYNETALLYEETIKLPNGMIKVIPRRYIVGNTANPFGSLALGIAILKLMSLYKELESAQDGLIKERDEARDQVVILQQELETERKRVVEMERQRKG